MAAPEPVIDPRRVAPEAACPVDRLSHAEIDLSCRGPLVGLTMAASVWLVVGLVLSLIGAIKLHGPGFLADTSWLTFGRIRPAASNALCYGFASQAAIAVALWIFCRLGANRLVLPLMIGIGAAIWNLALAAGIIAILAGASTGFELLEIPRAIWPILFTGYIFMGASALVTFSARKECVMYPSQWFLLAALFWFPWVYSGANLLLLGVPVRGTTQSVANAWYTHAFTTLWLGFIALAAILYFLPKLLRKPLETRAFAIFAFWMLLLIASFGSASQLVGGPVPAWIPSLGIAANLLALSAIGILAVMWHRTIGGAYALAWSNPVLKFILFAAGAYIVGSIGHVLLGLRELSGFTRFTYIEMAQRQLMLFGFIGAGFFGALHYILPRVVQKPWPSPEKVVLQFRLFAGGTLLLVLGLFGAGVIQASRIQDLAVPFVNVTKATIPFVGIATLGYLSLLASAVLFLWHLWKLAPCCCSGRDQ